MNRLTDEEGASIARLAADPEDPSRRIPADLIFRAALFESSIVDVSWRQFARLCQELLIRTVDDNTAWEQVAFARDIARRHVGEPALLEWPGDAGWFAALDADSQLAALAHAVQSAADADLGAVVAYTEAALARLEKEPTRPETLMLLGAVGRAYAAVGAFPEARSSLRRAVDGWFALGRAPFASFAICELLRLHGVQRDGLALREIQGRVQSVLDVVSDLNSVVFVKLALGRALLQVGELDSGRAALEDLGVSWPAAPPHARAARLRWLHFAALVRGDEVLAQRHLDELDALIDEGEPYDSDQRYLARIDRALATGTVLTPHVERLVSLLPGGDEAARTLARIAPDVPRTIAMNDRKVVERLAWEYRY